MKQKILTLTLIGILLSSCKVQSGGQGLNSETKKILTDFEKRIAKQVLQDNIGSISVAVVNSNDIIFSKSFGYADIEKKIIADTNTVYRCASISKSITAFLMMLLVQNGTIDLNDPIKKYLPEIANLKHDGLLNSHDITFKQLASHTSGIDLEPTLIEASSGLTIEWEEKVINAIPTTSVLSVPGEKFSYSNFGYALLGLALSRAANKPYIDLIQKMIFEPLNMKSSFFIIPSGFEESVAVGYRWHPFKGIIDFEKSQLEHKGRGYRVPNGGVYTTPNDLARFLFAQFGASTILSKEYLMMMQTIQTPESKDYGYGFGFYIRNNDKGIKMVEHDGGVAGYNAMMVFSPERKTGVIMMRNYDFGLTNILLEPRTLLSQLVKVK